MTRRLQTGKLCQCGVRDGGKYSTRGVRGRVLAGGETPAPPTRSATGARAAKRAHMIRRSSAGSSGRRRPLLPALSRWIMWARLAARAPVALRVGGAGVSPPASTPPRTPLALGFPPSRTSHWRSGLVCRRRVIPPPRAQARTSRSFGSTADDTHGPGRLGSNKSNHSVTKS